MSERFYCPRALESGGGPDSPFKPPMNGEAHWRDDRTCSYCGSISPELLFDQIEKGARLTPTDKSYKLYVDLIDARVDGTAKFYFQHLDDAGRDRFIALFNARAMTLGYPGFFYVAPYFARPIGNAGDDTTANAGD